MPVQIRAGFTGRCVQLFTDQVSFQYRYVFEWVYYATAYAYPDTATFKIDGVQTQIHRDKIQDNCGRDKSAVDYWGMLNDLLADSLGWPLL